MTNEEIKDRALDMQSIICNTLLKENKELREKLSKTIPFSEIENLRNEMLGISRVTDGEKEILWTCVCMIDDMLEQYKEQNNG